MRAIPLDESGKKRCSKCREYKDLSEFPSAVAKRYNSHGHCKKCHNDYGHRSYDYNREKDRQLRIAYGLSLDEYNEMLAEQGGVCAICKEPETSTPGRSKRTLDRVPMLHVDHCHTTGAVRGLLCTRCNTALGSLYEDPSRVTSMLDYINERVLW